MNLAKWLITAFHNIRVAGHTSTRRPYTGDELRAIRKRNGVGRPPAVMRQRLIDWGCVQPRPPHGVIMIGIARFCSPLAHMETPDYSEHNYAEWQRKPRPTPRGQTAHA